MKSIIFIILIVTQPCLAATYYVSNAGNDSNAGTSTGAPWLTVAKVNGFTFSDGDSVLFNRGDTFDDATLIPTGLNDNMTIGAYGTGDKPWFDGNTNKPIEINQRISNLTVQNLDISGMGWQATKNSNAEFEDIENLTIDGIDCNGVKGWDGVGEAMNVFTIWHGNHGTITVKNCTLENIDEVPLFSQTETDYIGISMLFESRPDTVMNIHDNTIFKIGADGVQIYRSTIPVNIYDNVIHTCGENSVDIKGADNVNVYDNNFYWDSTVTPPTQDNSSRKFVIVSESQGGIGAGVPPFQFNTKNCNIYGNVFTGLNDGQDAGLEYNSGATKDRVYNNIFVDCAVGIRLQNYIDNQEIYNNVFINCPLALTENNSEGGNSFVHNSIYGGRIHIDFCIGTIIQNNIIHTTDGDDYPIFWDNDGGTAPVVRYNQWYNSASTKRINWDDTLYNSDDLATWIAAGHAGELFSSPSFADPDANDLSTTGDAVDAGIEANVTTSYNNQRRPQGSGPDMGAYEKADGIRHKSLDLRILIF
jgi:hypothetical protein